MISICALQCRPNRLVSRAAALVVVAGFALGGGSVQADVARDALADIAKCSSIDDSMERLRCFDRAAPRAREALAPRVEDFGKPPAAAPEAEQVSARVREVFKTARGRAVFVLDNGQTWRQIDGDDAQVADSSPGEPPLRVTIAKGLFGSYNLTIEGRNGLIRVRRVD